MQCLRVGLRLTPEKASRTIIVCAMLHNMAWKLNLPTPELDDVHEEMEKERAMLLAIMSGTWLIFTNFQ